MGNQTFKSFSESSEDEFDEQEYRLLVHKRRIEQSNQRILCSNPPIRAPKHRDERWNEQMNQLMMRFDMIHDEQLNSQ